MKEVRSGAGAWTALEKTGRPRSATPWITALSLCVAACEPASPAESSSPPAPPAHEEIAPAPAEVAPAPPPSRPPLDGRAFPDKVLALTWDDGPDVNTLELAEFLAHEHVSATFFVVSEWVDGISAEPGAGTGVYDTGCDHLPVLGELVALGHRLGNHTLNHVLLENAGEDVEDYQLREDQARLDPFITNELDLFRAPGGAWNDAAGRVLDDDPELARLVGPIGWDIDRKDWEGSLYCRSSRPAVECERAAPGGELRVKPAVIARRYLAGIESMGHGVVLMHDRLGHVGSDFALHVAHLLIPQLEARGFVFAAPVLRFSRPSLRSRSAPRDFAGSGPIRLIDVDGDGRADVCSRTKAGTLCATSEETPWSPGKARETVLRPARRWEHPLGEAEVAGPSRFALAALRSADARFRGAVRFGDLNGDGRPDACVHSHEGVVCALSSGHAFLKATTWLAPGDGDPPLDDAFELGDLNGDGRADLCSRGPEGVVCALAP